jgi:hypothetical protein
MPKEENFSVPEKFCVADVADVANVASFFPLPHWHPFSSL